MSEGLSPAEVGNEIKQHQQHTAHGEGTRHERVLTIIEAVLLAVVAVLAAASGYASAKWSTESRLELAQASTARVEASNAHLEAMETRNLDSSTFQSWFTAYVGDDDSAMNIAERRFRPEFRVAFDAWIKTDPANNPDARSGPTFMPEYKQPGLEHAKELAANAEEHYQAGVEAGTNADDYVRSTLYLATVLFLVGISGHFRVKSARIGLVVVGATILTFAIITTATLPKPPG